MEKRPGFAQKLLDDLRLRKQRLASDKHIDSSNANTKQSSRSSREEYSRKTSKNNTPNTKMENVWHGTSREGTSQDIVPFRKTNGQQRTDVSIALRNIEQFRNGIIENEVILRGGMLNFTEINGNKFPLLLPSQMIEISKGIQQLNMILRAYPNGVIMSRKAIDIGRELLRGSKDLEESLKILSSLQDASNYLSSSSKNQIKLLRGHDDEPSSGEANNMKLIKPTFSFDKKSNKTNYKEKEIIDNDSILKCNLNRSSSNSHLQFNYHRRSLSAEFNMKPIERNEDFRSSLQGINHSGNIRQNDDKRCGLRNEKVRIPSVVAKLMGLEELPLAMSEVKKKEVQYIHNSNQIKANGNTNTHGKIYVSEMKGENSAKDKSSVHTNYVTNRENKNKIEPNNSKHKNSPYSENIRSTTRKRIDIEDKDFRVPKNEVTKARKNMLSKQPTHGEPAYQHEFKIQATEHSTENVSFLHEQPKIAGREKERRGKNVASISKRNVGDVNKAIKQKQSPFQKSKIKQGMDYGATKTKQPLRQTGAMFNTAENSIQKIPSSILIKHANKTSANFSEKKQLNLYPNEKCNEKNKSHKNSYVHPEVEDISTTNKSLNVTVNTDEAVMPQICQLEPVPTAERVEDKNFLNVINDNTVNVVEEIRTEITEVNFYNMKNKASFLHDLEQKLKERELKLEKAKISYHTMKFEEHSQHNADISLSSISDETYENCLTEQVEDQQENGRNSMLSQPTVVMDLAYPHTAEIHAVEDQELPLLPENVKSEDTVSNYAEMQSIYKSEVLDQRLTEEEYTLRNVLVNNSHFLNAAQALLKVKIPIGILQEAENICVNENNKLVLDTGYEVMRNKCKREEAHFTKKTPSALTQVRCFDNLIRELNADFKSLEPQCMTEDNISDCLQYMIEKDIENTNPNVNCMWDTCWSNVVIAYVEKEQIVKDLEKHVLNGLINELVQDLIAVHCIS